MCKKCTHLANPVCECGAIASIYNEIPNNTITIYTDSLLDCDLYNCVLSQDNEVLYKRILVDISKGKLTIFPT